MLVVDDNETSQQFLHQQVIAWRLSNGCARTGEEALAMLHQSVAEKDPYSVAIIDMQMPEMDGLALARKINAAPLLSETRLILLTPFGKPIPPEVLKTVKIGACCIKPVRQSALFAMTANAMVGDREKCLTAGMDDYLSKPLNRAELRAALERGAAKPAPPLDEDKALTNLKVDGEGESGECMARAPATIANLPPVLEKSSPADLWRDVTARDRITAALASQRHRLSTMMDNLPDNIWFKDRESRFVAANRAMLSWTGFKDQSEIVGKTDQDLFSEEHAVDGRATSLRAE